MIFLVGRWGGVILLIKIMMIGRVMFLMNQFLLWASSEFDVDDENEDDNAAAAADDDDDDNDDEI